MLTEPASRGKKSTSGPVRGPYSTPALSEPFGSFELLRLLGRGGMAEAFIAEHRSGGDVAPVVLKRIRPDYAHNEEYLRRFVLEAQVASRLNHPNLARFREFGRVGRCHYLVMDMVRGRSLHRLLDVVFRQQEPPPLEVALSLSAGILDGLAAMHAVKDEAGRPRPMLHRDVTPSNVIVADDGHPVIIDFGITKDVMGPAITLPGKVIGTARYMSPEHRRAEYIDTRADVFSASVILFELLFGKHPWPPLSTMKELLRVTFDPPDIQEAMLERVPRDIVDVVLRGVANDPHERFADAAEMRDALFSCRSCPGMVGAAQQRAVAAWAEGLSLPRDEDLSRPVVDLADTEGEEEVMWTASGALSTDEVRAEDPTLAPSLPLAIPPLPPPRSAALTVAGGSEDVDVRAALGHGWLPKVVGIGVALLTLGGLVWLFLDP